jgi:polyisoprenoid-binding protein YceI
MGGQQRTPGGGTRRFGVADACGTTRARAGGKRSRSLVAGATAALCLLAFTPGASAAPETWRFDPVHTQVWFSAGHQGYSHPLGRLRIREGWFQFDPDDWGASRVDVAFDLASADMGDAKWSAMVASSQFLDAARWPVARFVSRSVERRDATHGVIHGELRLHGRNRPVDVAFSVNRIATDPYTFRRRAGFSGQATLRRAEFGIDRYAGVVGDTVDLRLEIEGVPGDAPAPEEPR